MIPRLCLHFHGHGPGRPLWSFGRNPTGHSSFSDRPCCLYMPAEKPFTLAFTGTHLSLHQHPLKRHRMGRRGVGLHRTSVLDSLGGPNAVIVHTAPVTLSKRVGAVIAAAVRCQTQNQTHQKIRKNSLRDLEGTDSTSAPQWGWRVHCIWRVCLPVSPPCSHLSDSKSPKRRQPGRPHVRGKGSRGLGALQLSLPRFSPEGT